jgi:hypothetical protein
MIYPGPALPGLFARNITEEGLQKVLAAAAEAGLLGADKQYSDGGMVADAATTTFILNAGGRVHTISAYALFEADDMRGPNLSDEDFEARKRLKAFLNAVTNLPELVGASELTSEQEYTPHAVRIFVSDQAPVVDDSNPEQDEIAWPLETPLGEFGEQIGSGDFALNCGVVEGAELDTLLPLLEKANTLTPWTSEKQSYTILVRPMLPDETGCPTI